MALIKAWRDMAYNEGADRASLQKLWDDYFKKETGVYEQLLEDPDTEVKGTVRELADRFGLDLMTMTGFLDGIEESLKTPNGIEEIEEDSPVSLAFDKEKLYKNMVAAGADWLYNLPQWDKIYDAETRKRLMQEQKDSQTFRAETRVYPNDPCPCGSGKKYKKCHGRQEK